MDAEILHTRLAAAESAILHVDERLDAIEEALKSAAETQSSFLTQEAIPAILSTMREEAAAAAEQARAAAEIADAEARVAEAEAETAAAEETVAMLELEQQSVLDEEAAPEVEIIEEEASPETEASSTPTPKRNRDMEQIGFR